MLFFSISLFLGSAVDSILEKRTCPSFPNQIKYNLPVHIQDNVWLGAGCLVMPGVTIGENSVIGAGSVVTKDIPANVVAVGNPCRVLRDISEKDLTVYHKESLIDIE